MAKHACPSCGKQIDFERNGWICPYCGSVVLHSAEQAVYAREQLEQRQKAQKQKQKARIFGGAVWQAVRSKVLLAALFCVIIFGGAVLMQGKALAERKQSEMIKVSEQTVQCGEPISISPYEVRITGTAWAENFDGFPEEIMPPMCGKYLIVTFSSDRDTSEKKNVYAENLMWTCLDTGDGYLLPQYPMNLTGSSAVQSKLYDLGMGYQLDSHDNFLVFLVNENMQTDQLALRIYTGEPTVHMNMSENNAQNCYIVPLEVTP